MMGVRVHSLIQTWSEVVFTQLETSFLLECPFSVAETFLIEYLGVGGRGILCLRNGVWSFFRLEPEFTLPSRVLEPSLILLHSWGWWKRGAWES